MSFLCRDLGQTLGFGAVETDFRQQTHLGQRCKLQYT